MIKQLIVKTTFIILILCCLSSCKGNPSPAQVIDLNPVKVDVNAPASKPNKTTDTQYYFFNGSLLGSFSANKWSTLCNTDDQKADATDFFAKDILAQEKYYIYNSEEYIGTCNQIGWDVVTDGLGSFEDNTSLALIKYSEINNKDQPDLISSHVFHLPIYLEKELSSIKIPDYTFYTEFIFDNKIVEDFELATNVNIQPFPRKIISEPKATTEGLQALVNLFNINKMDNTAPNFTECIKSDFDNDGADEYLMFANNEESESGYPLLFGNGTDNFIGVYSVVIYQDDNGIIQILYSDLLPYDGVFTPDNGNKMELHDIDYCFSIDLLTIADLNSDGVYEIGVSKGAWESGYNSVYAMNTNGEYEIVMRSDSGL